MWNLEKDPHLSSSIANVTVLDQRARPRAPAGPARAGGDDGAPPAPARRARPSGRLAPPEWRDDPDFDLDYHLRWVGAARARARCASSSTSPPRSCSDPFDRTRPLWEFVVVEGLEGGRAAMIQKLHHAIADGEGSIRMSEQFIDLARDATEPIAPDRPVPEPHRRPASSRPPSTRSPTSCAAASAWRAAPSEGGVGLVARPAPARARSAATPSSSAGRRCARWWSSDPARSPLWTERSLRRRIEVLQVPFDDAKAAAKALGGSLNDLFVAAAAGGAGAYHRAAGDAGRRAAHLDAGQHPQGRLGRRQRVHADPRARAGRHRGPGRALRGHPGAARHHQARAGAGRRRRARRGRQPPADLGGRAGRPPAGRDGRLRHVERAGRAVPALHRRGAHRGQLPGRAHRRAPRGTSR